MSALVTVKTGNQFATFPKIGLEVGKTYAITYTYGGARETVERVCLDSVTSGNNASIKGVYTLGSMDGSEIIEVIGGEGYFWICDSCVMGSNGFELSSTNAVVVTLTGTESLLSKDLIIESIIALD